MIARIVGLYFCCRIMEHPPAYIVKTMNAGVLYERLY